MHAYIHTFISTCIVVYARYIFLDFPKDVKSNHKGCLIHAPSLRICYTVASGCLWKMLVPYVWK